MAERRETSDGRYVQVAVGEWWDTEGIDIYPEEIVDRYCEAEGVGIVVLEVDDSLGPIPDDGSTGKLN
jgi:hypothetical protein